MSAPSREQLVANYFVRTPDVPSFAGPLITWAAGTVTTLLSAWLIWRYGLEEAPLAALIILLAVGGIFSLTLAGLQAVTRWRAYRRDWAHSQPKPAGTQMDQWRAQGIEDAVNTGMRRLDLHIADADRRHDILVFPGIPQLTYAAVGEDDDILRFPRYHVLVVYLTSWRVSTYECQLDMYTGALHNDRTREFHLQQVDGIETQSDRIEFNLPSERTDGPGEVDTFQVTTRQQLQLLVSGRVAIGLTIALTVDNAWQASGMDRPAIDRLIARLREHLRNHMGGAHAVDPRVAHAHPLAGGLDGRLPGPPG